MRSFTEKTHTHTQRHVRAVRHHRRGRAPAAASDWLALHAIIPHLGYIPLASLPVAQRAVAFSMHANENRTDKHTRTHSLTRSPRHAGASLLNAAGPVSAW